jgi:hypothetical protein
VNIYIIVNNDLRNVYRVVKNINSINKCLLINDAMNVKYEL